MISSAAAQGSHTTPNIQFTTRKETFSAQLKISISVVFIMMLEPTRLVGFMAVFLANMTYLAANAVIWVCLGLVNMIICIYFPITHAQPILSMVKLSGVC